MANLDRAHSAMKTAGQAWARRAVARSLDMGTDELRVCIAQGQIGSALVGRFVEVLGELGDRADVACYGRRGVVANAEIFQHPLSECSHR